MVAQFKVTRRIEFCYGHRLLDYSGKCRFLHGHNGLVELDIEADSLDAVGMVLDFGEVRDIAQRWVDANLDHRMVLNKEDPAVPTLTELGEPLYLMDENPTAENISKLIFRQVREHGLSVSEVRLWETPSSWATYREG